MQAYILVAVCLAAVATAIPSTDWLIAHPYSSPFRHAPNTIRIEGIADLSGPFAVENTQAALGALVDRDHVNAQGGLCWGTASPDATDRSCMGGHRWNVSVVLWDVMRGGTIDQRLPLYKRFYREACSRSAASGQLPHVFVTPFSSTGAQAALDGIRTNATGALLPNGCNVLTVSLGSSPSLFPPASNQRFAFTVLPTPQQTLLGTAKLFNKTLGGSLKTFGIISKYGDVLSDSLSAGIVGMIGKGMYGPGVQLVGTKCAWESTNASAPVCATDVDCMRRAKDLGCETCAPQTCGIAHFVPQPALSKAVTYAFDVVNWIRYFKDLNPDVLVVGGHMPDMAGFMDALRYVEWAPKLAFASMPMALSQDIAGAASAYWFGNSLLLSTNRYGMSGQDLGTTADFVDAVNRAVPLYYNPFQFVGGASRLDEYLNAGMMAGGLVVARHLMEQAPGWSPAQNASAASLGNLMSQLSHLGTCLTSWPPVSCGPDKPCGVGQECVPFASFWGPHTFANGLNVAKQSEIMQFLPDPTLDPTSNAATSGAMVNNMAAFSVTPPTVPADWAWVLKIVPFEMPRSVRVANIVLITMSLTLIVTQTVMLCVHRNSKRIRAASGTFLVLMTLGAISETLSTLVYLPSHPTELQCRARIILPSANAVLIFTALLVRVYRVNRIFGQTRLRTIRIQDADLALIVAGAFVLQLVLVSSVAAYWYPSVAISVRPPEDIIKYTMCTESTPLIVMALMFPCTLLVIGAILAWRVRGVQDEFNESSQVANTLLFLVGYAILILPQLLAKGSDPETSALTWILASHFGVHIAIQPVIAPRTILGLCGVVFYENTTALESGAKVADNATRLSVATATNVAVMISPKPVVRGSGGVGGGSAVRSVASASVSPTNKVTQMTIPGQVGAGISSHT